MPTVQELIDMHKRANTYDYEHIRIMYIDGFSEGFSDVNNLQISGNKISFETTNDMRKIIPSHDPTTSVVEAVGTIIEKRKRIF